ncbi:MAG: PDZ domain-containing protein [Propionibacteriales bacterium]|nr:PDZ domain-containing protein [Propionibacteriales bacterium]
MSRRTAAGLLALGLAAVLVLFAALEPVPYVTFRPGPTVNVLGEYDGQKVIEIKGHPVYSDGGSLRLLTVYTTGPEQDLDLLTVFGGWLSPSTAILPKGNVYKKQDTAASVRQQSALQMTSSQDNAVVVGLGAAKIAYKTVVLVGAVADDGAAKGILEVDDELVKVNGADVVDVASLISTIRALPPGKDVALVIRRKGMLKSVTVRPRSEQVAQPAPSAAEAACPTGKPVPEVVRSVTRIGFTPAPRYVYPFDVKINLGTSIGGPSAGMMFALSIYDLLTPGSLTGGKAVAGTGEIAADGTVGAIGGIAQKMVGAQRDGARLFLVPSENWAEAIGSPYDKSKMRLVRVHTIADALTAINTWRQNPDAELKGCAG